MPSWVTLILTTLGAGAIGSIITTFGSQARDRRDARKEVLIRVAEADRISGQAPSDRAAIRSAARAVASTAMLAGVPVHVVDTYLLAYDAVRDPQLTWAPQRLSPQDPACVGIHIYREAVELLTNVLWHPLLTLPVRRHRSRHIQRFLTSLLPPGTPILLRRPRGARKWEREAIQAAKVRGNGSGA